jgi:predicted nuclease of predicted toxin-antitoxin system
VVSTDRDFVHLVERLGPPPKVIRIERCDFRAKVIGQLLRREAPGYTIAAHSYLTAVIGSIREAFLAGT